MAELNIEEKHSLINGQEVVGKAGTTRAYNPATAEEIGATFTLIDQEQLEEATQAAADSFESYSATDPEVRAKFLEDIADNLDAVAEDISETMQIETGLPAARAAGELARTSNQLRLFGKVVREGEYLGARIEHALPERTPLPRPDIRQIKIPVGPVGVFGASNFPLAFSVAGGDTASALAAGCPVVFKAHNAHPGLSQIVARAIIRAAESNGIHPGVFSLVYGSGRTVGQALAADPRIKAIGFTGSRSGGVALMKTAAARPEPIPVYAEMSSINPVFVLPSSIADSTDTIASGFVTSLTGSAGQLCTAPGLLLVPEGQTGDQLLADIARKLSEVAGTTMLTSGICQARIEGEKYLAQASKVEKVATGTEGSTQNAPAPAVYSTSVENFINDEHLSDEIFGSVCLAIRYSNQDELLKFIGSLEGQLTATLHLDTEANEDLQGAKALIEKLQHRVGRIIINTWPTGVDVGEAMVHGGPFPATADGRSTSVGTLAIDRFLRPVAFQGVPDALLAPGIKDGNPWNIGRRVDGQTHPQQ